MSKFIASCALLAYEHHLFSTFDSDLRAQNELHAESNVPSPIECHDSKEGPKESNGLASNLATLNSMLLTERETVAILSAKLNALQIRADDAGRGLQNAKADLVVAEESRSAVLRKLDEADSLAAAALAAGDGKQRSVTVDADKIREALECELSTVRESYSAQHAELVALQVHAASQAEENSVLMAQMQKTAATLASSNSALLEQLNAAECTLASNRDDLKDQAAELAILRKSLSAKTVELADALAQIAHHADTLVQAEVRYTALETNISSKSVEVSRSEEIASALRQELAATSLQRDEASATASQRSDDLIVLQREMNMSLSSLRDAHESAERGLRADISVLSATNAELEKRASSAEVALKSVESSSAALDTTVEVLRGNLVLSTGEVTALQTKVRLLESERDACSARIIDLESALSSATSANAVVCEQLAEANSRSSVPKAGSVGPCETAVEEGGVAASSDTTSLDAELVAASDALRVLQAEFSSAREQVRCI